MLKKTALFLGGGFPNGDDGDGDGADEHLLGGQLFQGRQNSPPKCHKIVSIKALNMKCRIAPTGRC